MAAQPPPTSAPVATAPPVLGPHSTFQEDVDHWSHRIKEVSNNTGTLEVQGSKEWSSSFFACFEPVDTCLITCCCPCVTFGKTHHRLHKDKNLAGYSPVNASCLGFWASAYCCLMCVPLMMQRSEIRKRAQPHLVGDTAMDFLKAFFCGCCDLVQQDKEAEYLLSHESNQYVTEQPAAVKQDMTYAPPPAAPVEHHTEEQKVGL